ncbi:MAG: hypothetical protein OEZ39_20535, partial [Gammaproteobacteria bacterium]|nr:hypothetical protein [Gammaproteobacteria bacterium]
MRILSNISFTALAFFSGLTHAEKVDNSSLIIGYNTEYGAVIRSIAHGNLAYYGGLLFVKDKRKFRSSRPNFSRDSIRLSLGAIKYVSEATHPRFFDLGLSYRYSRHSDNSDIFGTNRQISLRSYYGFEIPLSEFSFITAEGGLSLNYISDKDSKYTAV